MLVPLTTWMSPNAPTYKGVRDLFVFRTIRLVPTWVTTQRLGVNPRVEVTNIKQKSRIEPSGITSVFFSESFPSRRISLPVSFLRTGASRIVKRTLSRRQRSTRIGNSVCQTSKESVPKTADGFLSGNLRWREMTPSISATTFAFQSFVMLRKTSNQAAFMSVFTWPPNRALMTNCTTNFCQGFSILTCVWEVLKILR